MANDPTPVAVAVSGGGDSVALLHLSQAWARRHGRQLSVLHIDHGLSPESGVWQDRVRDLAERLGASFHQARWEGPRPDAGLPAAARAARHARLADMARRVGARVILTGHTADDVAEGHWMQADGSTLGSLRDWSPSPAWPEGRGLMMFRPLIEERRAELRAWLTGQGEGWIDDPSNADPRFGRSRARKALAEGVPAIVPVRHSPQVPGDIAVDALGVIRADRRIPARTLAFGLVIAGGGDRLPRGRRLAALRQRIESGEVFEAGLVGARLVAGADGLMLVREPGDYRRKGVPRTQLVPGREAVWDGRYALTVDQPGWQVVPLSGRMARLDRTDATFVARVPAAVRPGLPVLVRDDRDGPVLAWREARVLSLAGQRLALALGQVGTEADLKCRREWRMDGRVPIL